MNRFIVVLQLRGSILCGSKSIMLERADPKEQLLVSTGQLFHYLLTRIVRVDTPGAVPQGQHTSQG